MDSKDLKRLQDIADKKWNDAMTAASKQCKLIKNPDKAWSRFLAAVEVGRGCEGNKMKYVAKDFLDRACELGHPRAIRFKEISRKRDEHRRKLIRAEWAKVIRPNIDKFIKAVEKRVNIKCRVSTMCGYPYWNHNGLFVSFDFLGDDAPYSGYDSSGPSYITNYRRSYLGKNLSKIATITKRFNCGLYKSSNSIFVLFPWEK
jgi:hypothetical protein